MNLQFKLIEISNFQCFDGDHKLRLDTPGVIYVTGSNHVEPELTSNGVGKSTIFNALVWCLYGRTLRAARPATDIVPWHGNGSPIVCVVYERDGTEYSITRGRNPSILILNDESVQQDAINKALGLSYEAFANCIVVGQFNNLFLSLRPEEQTALFTELLDLEVWVRSVENATRKLRSTEGLLENAERTLSRHQGSLEEVTATIEQLGEASILWQQHQQTELDKLQQAVTDATEAWKAVKEAVPEAVDVGESERAIEVAQKSLRRLRAALDDAETNRRVTQRELDKLDSQIDQVEKTIKKYEDADKECPECGQTVSDEHLNKKWNDAQDQLEELKKLYEEKGSPLDISEVFISETKHSIQELDNEINEALPEIEAVKEAKRLYEHRVKIAELTRNGAINDFNQCRSATNPHVESLKQADIRKTQLKNSIKGAIKARDLLTKELGDIKYWVGAFKQIRLDLIDATLSELEIAVTSHAEALGLQGWRVAFETERETVKGDIRNKFTTLLFPPSSEDAVPIENLSGGEIQRWQLACVFGLSEVLLSRAGLTSNLLVLDEPTHHLSEAGVDGLLSYLKTAITDNKTIFFIDHHSIDSGNFSGVLCVDKTEAGSSLRWN